MGTLAGALAQTKQIKMSHSLNSGRSIRGKSLLYRIAKVASCCCSQFLEVSIRFVCPWLSTDYTLCILLQERD